VGHLQKVYSELGIVQAQLKEDARTKALLPRLLRDNGAQKQSITSNLLG
jgi:hypothetical protein